MFQRLLSRPRLLSALAPAHVHFSQPPLRSLDQVFDALKPSSIFPNANPDDIFEDPLWPLTSPCGRVAVDPFTPGVGRSGARTPLGAYARSCSDGSPDCVGTLLRYGCPRTDERGRVPDVDVRGVASSESGSGTVSAPVRYQSYLPTTGGKSTSGEAVASPISGGPSGTSSGGRMLKKSQVSEWKRRPARLIVHAFL